MILTLYVEHACPCEVILFLRDASLLCCKQDVSHISWFPGGTYFKKALMWPLLLPRDYVIDIVGREGGTKLITLFTHHCLIDL